MASSNGAGAAASPGKKPLPKYYAGIPKDLGKRPTKSTAPKLDAFGANLLANFERSNNIVRQRKLAEERRAAKQKAAEEAQRKAMLQRQAQEEVAQSLRKSLGKGANGGNRLRNRLSGGPSKRGVTKSRAANSSSRANGAGSSREKRRGNRRPDDESDDDDFNDGRNSLGRKGMERIVLKKKPKAPVARKPTSDYSDMFGPNYLVGADFDATQDLAKESRGERERARAEKRKKQEALEAKKKEAAAFDAIKLRMERSGEARTKAGKLKLRKLRDKLMEGTFERVNEPKMNSEIEKSSIKNPKVHQEVLKGSNEKMKEALRNRLKNWGVDPTSQKMEPSSSAVASSRSDDRDKGRRHSYPASRPVGEKRKRVVDSDQSDEDDEYDRRYSREYRDSPRRRRPSYSSGRSLQKKSRRDRRRFEASDSEESEDDRGGGMFESSFGDLEEEEARSAAAGRAEDRRERLALLKHKREKEARKRAAGIYSDDDD